MSRFDERLYVYTDYPAKCLTPVDYITVETPKEKVLDPRKSQQYLSSSEYGMELGGELTEKYKRLSLYHCLISN